MVQQKAIEQLDKKIRKNKITSCLIMHQDTILYRYYKNRKMEQKLHKINSVTKSVLSILVGIAIDHGKLSLDDSLSKFYANLKEGFEKITVEHLLTMSPGFDWPEFGSWGGRAFPMINSSNWIRFILNREMIHTPGEVMAYNTGCSHLLSDILQKVTGEDLAHYGKKQLFSPLGIQEYTWHTDSQGIGIGGFGLSLKTIDLANIGKLMLQEGKFKNKVVVSKGWVEASTEARLHTYNQIGSYGYHWWILTNEKGERAVPDAFFAMGYGGQYIIVVPEYQLITVFTSELYEDTFLPLQLFRDYIYTLYKEETSPLK